MKYLGEFVPGKTIVLRFNTHTATGTPITLAGTPAVSVYKNSTTESAAGVTLTVDYDSRTGFHHVAIDTSADGTFYAAGNDFDVVITTGTVDSVSVAGTVVGSFSLANRAGLRPTTADRTLDVSAGGEAGVDWANVGTPGSTVALSATTINLGTNAPAGWLNTAAFADGAITAGKFASQALDAVWSTTTRTLSAAGVAAIWDALTSALATASSIGKLLVDNINATISSRATPAQVNTEVDTALSDIGATIARMGYLDNLNIGGLVSSAAGVAAITQAQRVRVVPPIVIERPDAGSETYRVWIYSYNELHRNEDLDANPTVTAENNQGTDRSANLGTVTKPGGTTGTYYVDYTVSSAHAIEALVFKVAATEDGVTNTYAEGSFVSDTTAIDFTSADRTKLEAVYNKLPSKDRLAGTNNSDGDIELNEATGGLPADSITASAFDESTAFPLTSADSGATAVARTGADGDTLETLSDQLDAVKSDTAAILLDTGTDGVVVAAGSKAGYSLASTGVDSIILESGITAGAGLTNDTGTQLTAINLRQGMAAILSAGAGVLSGVSSNAPAFKQAAKPAGNTRISATVTSDGRTAVTLKVPD